MKKMCGGNQAQTLLEKHNALRNCFERKETLFCAKEGKFWPKLSKNEKIKKVTTKKERRKKKGFFYKLAVWRGKPAHCSFPFDDFFSFLSFSRIPSSAQWFGSNHKVKMVWFTDLVLFLAFCNRAHILNKPSKGNQQMATSNQVLKKIWIGNQAQTLFEKHSALGNCFKRKETLFCAKEGSSDQNWAK